ncbi:MAG: amidohydrolase family protein, partial [Pseudoflavonifractor sp.]|nr:amidohydrolase family protein [Pseudoflavonifractor sp.]
DSVYHLPGFESAKYLFAPPARPAGNQEALWKALEDGTVDTIGTDHCSFTTAIKALGRDDFSKIPGGLPGTEDRVVLLYTYGVAAGKLTPHRMMELLSSNSAKLFGMYPQKGALQVGSDADVVIYDPNKTGRIHAAANHSACDYDPYEGKETVGGVDAVLLNGALAVQNGEPLGEPGGRFVKRGPSQFWR